MADIKVIYKNSDGYDQEHSETADSIKLLSLKTANYELTDTKLGALISGGDGSTQHTHDSVYFRENEFIDATAGAADAGKPVKTAASGYVNPLIDVATLNAALDHGTLAGLGDDDHTQYLLATGARNLSGVQSYASHPTFSADTQLVDKKYVDDLAQGLEWQDSVISSVVLNPTALTPSAGDRYLINGTGAGAWSGKDNQIAEWNGSAWIYTVPTLGMHVAADNLADSIFLYTGSSWTSKSYEVTTASLGLTKVGNDIRIDASAAGDGLSLTTGVLAVKVAAAGGLEIATDEVQIKADGVKDTMIDFGTGAGQVSAVDIPIADAGSYTAQTEVEGALQELYGLVSQVGVNYTVGVGGVTKGLPVYISANNTVLAFGALSSTARVIGVAATTEIAAATVKALANDTVVTGVLTGATAGQVIYWDGSALTATIPTGSGSHVWKMGIAKNATDLHAEVEFIKKSA